MPSEPPIQGKYHGRGTTTKTRIHRGPLHGLPPGPLLHALPLGLYRGRRTMEGRGAAGYPGAHQGQGRGRQAGTRGHIARQVLLLFKGWLVLHTRDQAHRMP